MLDAKRYGAIDIEGIGRLSWPEFVALADVLLGTLWIDPRPKELEKTIRGFYAELSWNPLAEGSAYGSRNGALALLAWFFRGWPWRPGPAKARQLLGRWLRAPRSRISRHLYRNRSDELDAGPRLRHRSSYKERQSRH